MPAMRVQMDSQRVTLGMQQLALRMGPVAAALTRHHGQLLQTRVKAKASGRPGPNAPTGDYRRSITMELHFGAGTVEAQVGTNRPQGRRLEFGFHGRDSAGRSYNQPPYPHYQPALDDTRPGYVKALSEAARGGWSR